MNREITGDVIFFLSAVLLGAVAALCYDLLRVWRRFRAQSLFAVSLQDFVYWFLLGLAGFRLMYYYNDGILRLCAFLGGCLGACLYAVTIGRFFVTSCLKLLLFFTFPLRRGLLFLRKQGKLLISRMGKTVRNRKRHGRKDALAKKKRKKNNRPQASSAGGSGNVRSVDVQQRESR